MLVNCLVGSLQVLLEHVGALVVTCLNLNMTFLLTCEHVQISFLKYLPGGLVYQ